MIWVILQNYAGIELNELNGPLINRIENIMTVERNLHPGFGKMEWWLNPVPVGTSLSIQCHPDLCLDCHIVGRTQQIHF